MGADTLRTVTDTAGVFSLQGVPPGIFAFRVTAAGYVPQDPDRPRRLLMHAAEIRQYAARVEQKGLTVVPVSLYFKHGKIKMEIALGRGKKLFDHRESLKRRAEERDAARELA